MIKKHAFPDDQNRVFFNNLFTPPRLEPITPSVLTSKYSPLGPQCPKCGANTELAVVPCPDPPEEIAPGVYKVCAAVHYGWHCHCCGISYREVGAKAEGRDRRDRGGTDE